MQKLPIAVAVRSHRPHAGRAWLVQTSRECIVAGVATPVEKPVADPVGEGLRLCEAAGVAPIERDDPPAQRLALLRGDPGRGGSRA